MGGWGGVGVGVGKTPAAAVRARVDINPIRKSLQCPPPVLYTQTSNIRPPVLKTTLKMEYHFELGKIRSTRQNTSALRLG